MSDFASVRSFSQDRWVSALKSDRPRYHMSGHGQYTCHIIWLIYHFTGQDEYYSFCQLHLQHSFATGRCENRCPLARRSQDIMRSENVHDVFMHECVMCTDEPTGIGACSGHEFACSFLPPLPVRAAHTSRAYA